MMRTFIVEYSDPRRVLRKKQVRAYGFRDAERRAAKSCGPVTILSCRETHAPGRRARHSV